MRLRSAHGPAAGRAMRRGGGVRAGEACPGPGPETGPATRPQAAERRPPGAGCRFAAAGASAGPSGPRSSFWSFQSPEFELIDSFTGN